MFCVFSSVSFSGFVRTKRVRQQSIQRITRREPELKANSNAKLGCKGEALLKLDNCI